MSGLTSRISANVLAVLVVSVVLVVGAFLTYASGVVFDDSYEVQVALPEAGGVLPDQQVTVLGRAVGQVREVEVTTEGVLVTLSIQGDQRVPDPAITTVLRRSPIGEQAIDLAPPETDWTAAEAGTAITAQDITIAPEVANLLDETVAVFSEIGVDDVTVLVEDLAVALDGRGPTLRRLGRDSVDLGRTLVGGIPEFERLLATSEATLDVLVEQRDTLRSVIREGADLAEVFAEQRPNLDDLLDEAPRALDEAEALLINARPNLGCLLRDLTEVNEMLLGPSTYEGANGPDLYSSKLDELERALASHVFFFQQGYSLFAQYDVNTGLPWLRVLLKADSPQKAEFLPELRDTPTTTPGAACDSEAFGPGVDAVRQPGVQAPHETAGDIDFAPRRGSEPDRVSPQSEPTEPRVGEPVAPVPSPSASTSGSTAEDGSVTELLAGTRPGDPGDPVLSTPALLATVVAALSLPLLATVAWRLRRRPEEHG